MSTETRRRGPALHHFLVYFFGALLTLLLAWLLSFVLNDIDRLPGPDYDEIELRHVDAGDLDRLEAGQRTLGDIRREIDEQKHVQEILRTSTDSSRATMDQLLQIHRLSLEKGVTPTAEEQAAMAESEQLFLANQREFQQANDAIAELNRRQRDLQGEMRALEARIDESREPAVDEWGRQYTAHQFRMAALKLAFLVPLFLLSGWLVVRRKGRTYRPIFYAALIATAWKVGVVMHQHFPSELFKYIAIGVGLLVVLVAIVKLIRMMVAPQRDWLLKQYREAYHRHRCPICGDPIRRGPMRHARWTRRGPVAPGLSERGVREADDPPYACPACGTRLFEPCAECRSTRHSLLPYCDSCGCEKPVEGAPEAS